MTAGAFREFSTGLNMAVSPLNWGERNNDTAAAVKECLQQVARVHGASYHDDHFKKVSQLLSTGAMKGYAMRAYWRQAANEACLPRTIALALGSDAVILKRQDGELLPFFAEYRDDTAILKQSLSKLLRECPNGMRFPPDFHLSRYMEQEIQGLLREGGAQRIGTWAEVSPENTLIMRAMQGLNAEIGMAGPVLEFGGQIPSNQWKVDVTTELPVRNRNGQIVLPSTFLTRWIDPGDGAEIGAAFSLCPSSMSKSVPHVYLASNGVIPDAAKLKDILTSLLAAGQEHIKLRREEQTLFAKPASPLIEIHAGREKAWKSLIRLSGHELSVQHSQASIFGEPLSEMRIYCFEEKLHKALLLIDDMKRRSFGSHALHPLFLRNGNNDIGTARRPLYRVSGGSGLSLDQAA